MTCVCGGCSGCSPVPSGALSRGCAPRGSLLLPALARVGLVADFQSVGDFSRLWFRAGFPALLQPSLCSRGCPVPQLSQVRFSSQQQCFQGWRVPWVLMDRWSCTVPWAVLGLDDLEGLFQPKSFCGCTRMLCTHHAVRL